MNGIIRQGFGYWDCTVFPIGGKFRRASAGGLPVTDIETFSPKCHGANATANAVENGRAIRVAFATDVLEPVAQETAVVDVRGQRIPYVCITDDRQGTYTLHGF